MQVQVTINVVNQIMFDSLLFIFRDPTIHDTITQLEKEYRLFTKEFIGSGK